MATTRLEHDALGDVQVPADRLWGAQTQRSLEYFAIGVDRFRFTRPVIRALGLVKKGAARANHELGELDAERARLIEQAADRVIDGEVDAEFPLVVFQTGSGTQSNMNANEVIANLANLAAGAPLGGKRPVHPNDHVNKGQSSNDAFPAVMHIASVEVLVHRLLPAVDVLRATLVSKAHAFDDVVMIGRTHLQDATPITLGQVIDGWVAQIDAGLVAVRDALDGLMELALGATAVGTGLNAHPQFGARAAAHIAALTGQPFRPPRNLVAALAGHEAMAAASAALRLLAGALMKTANDIRLYASGPRAGIGELRIPENEPGSSIMPGKVNPVIPEVVNQVCFRVIGSDLTVTMAAEAGQLQLNVFEPVIAACIFEAQTMFINAARTLREHCVEGITANPEICRHYVDYSIGTVTALNPLIGYERTTELATEAMKSGRGILELVREKKILSEAELARVLDPAAMTGTRPPA